MSSSFPFSTAGALVVVTQQTIIDGNLSTKTGIVREPVKDVLADFAR